MNKFDEIIGNFRHSWFVNVDVADSTPFSTQNAQFSGKLQTFFKTGAGWLPLERNVQMLDARSSVFLGRGSHCLPALDRSDHIRVWIAIATRARAEEKMDAAPRVKGYSL
jgi:hypothetical protein